MFIIFTKSFSYNRYNEMNVMQQGEHEGKGKNDNLIDDRSNQLK